MKSESCAPAKLAAATGSSAAESSVISGVIKQGYCPYLTNLHALLQCGAPYMTVGWLTKAPVRPWMGGIGQKARRRW